MGRSRVAVRSDGDDTGGVRREPGLPDHEEIAAPPRQTEFDFDPTEDDEPVRRAALQRRMRAVARQVALDPNDGMDL
jgi:type IV secretion system protein VirD4